jgi:hypothetical protein
MATADGKTEQRKFGTGRTARLPHYTMATLEGGENMRQAFRVPNSHRQLHHDVTYSAPKWRSTRCSFFFRMSKPTVFDICDEPCERLMIGQLFDDICLESPCQ